MQCIAIPIKNFELVKDDVITDNGITITTVEASLSNRETVTDGIESVSSGYTASESSGYGSETSKVTRRLNRRTHYAESHEKEYALKMRYVFSFCAPKLFVMFNGCCLNLSARTLIILLKNT